VIPCCRRPRAFSVPLLACLIAAVLGLAWHSVARAAEPADVEDLIRQGVELRQKGRDQAAVPLFQRAYELDRSPRTAAQLGLVEANLGYWLASERHLTEALAAPRHPWVYKMRPQLEQTLKEVRSSIGEIQVEGTPSGAEVLINGKLEGVLPLAQPIRANEGVAQIAVRAPGFEEKQTTLQVVGGNRQKIAFTLIPGGPKVRERETSSAGGSSARRSNRPRISTEASLPSSSSSAPSWVRPVAWVAAGLAVFAVGVGGYELVVNRQKQDEFNTRLVPGTKTPECDAIAANKGGMSCKSIYNQGASAQNLAISAFGGAAILGGAALIGFLWSADVGHSESAARSGPIVAIDADGAHTGWMLRF
jgi:hypothetical protein